MDMQRLMQQANAMQRQLKKVEEELEATIYTGQNNGVKVQINGRYEVVKVFIPADMLNSENQEMIQDLIQLAANQAVSEAAKEREEKMGALTHGVSFPGL